MQPGECSHLMHLPSGKCIGCGEQHQPLADYQPGDDEKYLADDETTAQPGQEQRMEQARKIVCESVKQYEEIAGTIKGTVGIWLPLPDWQAVRDALTRPTADLGEDGELIARLRAWDCDSYTDCNTVCREAADRLILYREARAEALSKLEDVVSCGCCDEALAALGDALRASPAPATTDRHPTASEPENPS